MIHLLLPKLGTQFSPSLFKAVTDSAQSVSFSLAWALLSISPTAKETPLCQAWLMSHWSPQKRNCCCNCQTQFVSARTLLVSASQPSWKKKGEIFLCRSWGVAVMSLRTGWGLEEKWTPQLHSSVLAEMWSGQLLLLIQLLHTTPLAPNTQLFKKCLSFSSPWYTVAVCLLPLCALTWKQCRSAYQSRCHTLPFSCFKVGCENM